MMIRTLAVNLAKQAMAETLIRSGHRSQVAIDLVAAVERLIDAKIAADRMDRVDCSILDRGIPDEVGGRSTSHFKDQT